ncbi:PPE domain-containing protein [Amycolatopsis sp. TRM77291]
MRILPMPWPPREPEPRPGPEHLNADIDWMSYSHRELYEMVHDELDLASAEAVAAQWTKISAFLDRVGSELRAALVATADGWTGEGADRARDAAIKLVDWAGETGWRAENVANCVRRQADIADTARRTMPEPPGYAPRPKPPEAPKRRPIPVADQDSTQAMSASPPSGGGFAEAGRIVAEPTDESSQDLHRQAADVMTRMQRSSGEVYENVPTFTSYGKQPRILETPEEPTPKPEPTPEPVPPPDDTTSSSGVDDTAAPIQVREPVEAPRQPGASSGAYVPPPPGTSGGTQEQLGQGGRSGAGGFGPSGPQPGQVAGTRAAAAGIGGVGGMPMGMMPPQGQQDGQNRKTPDYLVEDSDVWGLSGQVTPPVIGEDPRTDR